MRITLCAILAFLVIGCSPSNEKKAQKLIAAELKQSLNDYSSYESVSYGTLDSVFNSLLEDTVYFSKKMDLERYQVLVPIEPKYQDSINALKPYVDSVEQAFKPKLVGWRMSHKFRSNNALGAKVLGEYLFFFDTELTKITETKTN